MNPSTVEIKVDLNKKYEWKYDFSGDINSSPNYKLIYSIDKAEKDMILQFKYNENIYIPSYNYGGIHVNNQLKICSGGVFCSVGQIYKIRKGESYKIYITTQHVFDSYRYVHYLPSFSIQFIEPKGIKPEFGKEISFDIDNNNKFESNFSEDGSLFIRVDFNISNLLDIIISSSIDNYSTTIQPPGLQTVIPFKKEKNIEIYLKYKLASNEKGKIWMYLSTQEIKVNLNQTYEFKYDFKRTCGHQITSNLIYSIDNAEYNALLQFRYNNKLIVDKNMNAGNPMKILDGKEYKTNITSYIINKGNSYKIYINTKFFVLNKNKIEYIHYLPYFSLNFISIKKEPPLGKEIYFDRNNNNAFKFIYPKDGGLFIRIDFNISDALNLKIFSALYNFTKIIKPPGLIHVIPFQKNKQIIISLLYESSINEKGIIYMYSTRQEIQVDLNQTYQFKYDFKGYYNNNIYLLKYRLIYLINNASKNMTLQFIYKNPMFYKNFRFNNLLKVCHEGKCKTNKTTYKIKKGESYKIYISINSTHNDHEYMLYLQTFSFNITEEEEKVKIKFLSHNNLSCVEIACIIIISNLIIVGIGLSCFLICRKNRKPNNEIKTSEFIELASKIEKVEFIKSEQK